MRLHLPGATSGQDFSVLFIPPRQASRPALLKRRRQLVGSAKPRSSGRFAMHIFRFEWEKKKNETSTAG